MEAVSIAGLVLAVFDQILKVGERTAILISNYHDFNKDAKSAEERIRHEISRTNMLRVLLFQPCKVYNGLTLFEQFSEDVQSQILQFLEDFKDLLKEAEALAQHQSSSPAVAATSSQASLASSLTLVPPQMLHHKASGTLRRWKWAFFDKDRLQKLMKKIQVVNRSIHDNVQLWCHATALGVNSNHMRHLCDNATSQQLGFDMDARLQLLISNSTSLDRSYEIEDSVLQRSTDNATSRIDERFSICLWKGKQRLIEFRSYAPLDAGPQRLQESKREVTEKLAALLYQTKEMEFRTPACLGWYMDRLHNRVGLIFDLPEEVNVKPRTLLDALKQQNSFPLGDRFYLAHILAKSMSRLQMVQWVHESFRSDNILFFSEHMIEPWILGFANSRPEEAFSSGRADADIARDVYRHPSRQGIPTQPFRKTHDVYALGVVLLEIGLWKPAINMEREQFRRVKDGVEIRKYLIKLATRALPICMGEKYKNAVVACLSSDLGVDDTENLDFQRAFRVHVVDVLGHAAKHT